MREVRKFLSIFFGLSQWNHISRFGFIGLPLFIALGGLISLFSAVDIKPTSAAGTTHFVTVDGDGACTDIDPCDLQTAVSNATINDEIHVAAGTYTASAGSPLLLINKTITLTGGYDKNDWEATPDPQNNRTILDGQNNVQVVRIEGTVSPTVEGFEIYNGKAGQGAGIFIEEGNPLIRNNHIYDNDGSQSGGAGAGIFDRGSAIIENNIIHDNFSAVVGGGIFVDNSLTSGFTTISFNEIYSNTANPANSSSLGGGIYLESNSQALIEGNHIHKNRANSGAGFGTIGNNITATLLLNNMFYENEADAGDGLGGGIFAWGIVNIWNNTIAGNSAHNGGGIFAAGGATVQISNTIVVSNTGSNLTGIRNAGATISGDFNNIFGNSSNPTFTTTISTNPNFINFDTFNLHLRKDSPNIDKGDPNTPASINIDIDGQARPNPDNPDPTRVDIGADEFYDSTPAFILTPDPNSDSFVNRGETDIYTHTLENTGTVNDDYTITCDNDRPLWTVTCPTTATLNSGFSTGITTSVSVPASASGLAIGKSYITVTSVTSPTISKTIIMETTVAPRPGITFTPNFTDTLLPGDAVTFTHRITNTGDSPDTFSITIDPEPNSWAEILPSGPYSLPLNIGASVNVQVKVTVPDHAESGWGKTAVIRATSDFDPQISATVLNTVTAKATVGTRYVAVGGDNDNNNCTQANNPCETIARGVDQALSGDEVRIHSGIYQEKNIFINKDIYLSGGWQSSFISQTGPDGTIIEQIGSINDKTRFFEISSGTKPTIYNLTLDGGFDGQGGAILINNSSEIELTSLILKNNGAGFGGAIYAEPNTLVTISNTHFLTNTATTLQGGALYIDGGTVNMQHSSFINNEATVQDGGALYLKNNTSLSSINNLFHNNRAGGDGGAIFADSGMIDVIHNTYVSNETGASGTGGAVYNNTANLNIDSSIIVSNTANSYAGVYVHDGSATATINYSDLWNNNTTPDTNVTDYTNNISADPLFMDDQFHLGLGSPAIDTGNPDSTQREDFEYDLRPSDQGYDMGYDELPGCLAKRDGEIFGSIQLAVDKPDASSDMIYVSGICRGVNTIVVNNETISQTVHLTETVTIQGGWNSNFTSRTFEQTTIDPEGNGRGIFISGGSSVQPVIETITIINGDATDLGGGPADEDAGGNIYNLDADPTLIAVEVMTGTAVLGGGIYNHSGTFSMTAYFSDGYPSVIRSNLVGNTATDGGAIYVGGGVVTINAPEIYSNTAVNGAGLFASSGTITVTNAILANNIASDNGGAIYNDSGTTYVLHTTIYSNTATNDGGGIYNATGSPMVRNNIFESNQATNGNGPAIHSAAGTPDVDFNYYYNQADPDVSGTAAGNNSIESLTSPGLLDPANNNFHLAEGAPAIDVGDPDSPVTGDYEDDPRPSNQSTDMGADEVAGCRVRLNGIFYGSIQAALADANPGNILDVAGKCSGVHEYVAGPDGGACRGDTGAIFTTVHIDKDVTLRGGWDMNFSGQGSVTTLDAFSLGRVIHVAQGASPTIEQFEIRQGLLTGANGNGAGICIDQGASPTLLNNTIYSNTATNGAAIYSFNSTPIIKEGNRIYSNTATLNGGGLFIEASPATYTATIQNNFVYSNTAVSGGAIYNNSGDNYLWHNTIVGNDATTGGAIYVADDSPEIRSNLIISNSAIISGGAYFAPGSTASLSYNNFFSQMGGNYDSADVIVDIGNQFVDPGFVDETYQISIESLVVDLGDPTMPITEDFEADIRPSHQGFDIGADEVDGCFAYISPDSTTVYGSLQQAIDLANDGDTILVRGTCYGVNTHQNSGAEDVTQNTFISKNLTINGSWSGIATLDAMGKGRVVYIDSGTMVTLTKMVLTNGDAAGAGVNSNGGGLYNTGTLILDQVDVFSNTASSGGGIYNTAVITLDNSTIEENVATDDGAGLYNNIGTGFAQIINETMFQKNIASRNGGAIYQNSGELTLDGNNLYENTADNQGGAIYLNSGSAIAIQNNFIIRNNATSGGAVFNNNTNAKILHNTLYNNTATSSDGAGIYSQNDSLVIRNNIVDLNNGSGIYAPVNTNVQYNNVASNTVEFAGGVNLDATNIMTDSPTYIEEFNDNFHLIDNSVGVDEADPNSLVKTDFDGHLRPTNGGPDMGADEINSCLIRVIPPGGDAELFGVLQDAINRAEEFDPPPDIEVARGECTGVKNENGTLQLGYITKDLNFIGSLRRINFSDPDDYHNDTVGTISSIFNATEDGRVIVIGSPTATVSFTHIAFVNGNAAAAGDSNNNGGAIYNPGAEVSFSEVFLCDSEAENGGGYYGGPGSVSDVTGTSFGYCRPAHVTEDSSGSVVDFPSTYRETFYGNNAASNGGGFYSEGHYDMRNVVFEWNMANHGAGIYNTGDNNRIINGTFYSNSATLDGGSIYHAGSKLEIYHNTFVSNTAGGDGGAIWHDDDINFVLNSSILYENSASGNGGGLSSISGDLDYNNFYNNLPNNTPNDGPNNVNLGPNVILADPNLYFTYLVYPESPVIDQADPGLLDPGVTGQYPLSDQVIDYDRGMNTRPDGVPNHNGLHGKGSDIGSHEYLKDFGCRITPSFEEVTAVPGGEVVFNFDIQNYGRKIPSWYWHGYTDTISITLQPASGWGDLQYGNEQAITLGWKESVSRLITVTVPLTASNVTYDVTINCQSASMPSRTGTGTARTKVGLVADVIVTPDYVDTALPGDVITYAHRVTNLGNAAGDFVLKASAGPQHASAFLVDDLGTVFTETVVALQPNEFYTVNLRVHILPTAAATDFAKPGVVATEIKDGILQPNTGASINTIEIGYAPGTRHIATIGASDTTNCTDPANPCKTIQYAIDQSVDNDTILISTGTYTDTITRTFGADVADQLAYIEKSITIRGGYNAADGFTSYEPITNAVTLDGEDLRRVFFITDGITVTLSSIFIENGNSTLQEMAPTDGGAIYNNGAKLTITGTWFISNTAQFGGALYHQSDNLLINSSVFAKNGTILGSGQGGALYLDSGSNDIINNTFANNALTADGEGGAIYVSSGSLDLFNNIFAYNQGEIGKQAVFSQTLDTFNNDFNLFTNSFNEMNFTEGPGSRVGDPAFGDAFYHITTNSDAKDTGTNTWLASGIVDFELDTRPQPEGGFVDIGADERVQEPGFRFEPIAQSAVISTSELFTYTHFITNTGDEDDGYTLTMTHQSIPAGGGFTYSLTPTQTQVISPGDSIQVTFEITAGLQGGYVDQTVITTTSNTGISKQVVDTTTISQTALVDIEASESGLGSPGQAIEYSHVLTNTGDGIDSFTILPITATATYTTWIVTVNPTQTSVLDPGEKLPFTVTVNVPPGTFSDTVHAIEIEAVSMADPTTTDILTDTTTVGADYGLTLTPDNSSISPDKTQVVYTHTLQNIGNLVDKVQLLTPSSTPDWAVDMQPTAGTTITLTPLEKRTIYVTVTVPANMGGLMHTAVITAESQGGDQVTAVNTTTVEIIRGVSLESDSLLIDDAGETVTHTFTLTNTGNITDDYGITFLSSAGWITDTTPSPIKVGPGMTETVTATGKIDGAAAPPDVDITVITATSQISPTVFDLVTATTRLRQNHGVLFAPDRATTTASGAEVTYTHYLTNTGNYTDSYTLNVNSTYDWERFLPSVPITVGAGISTSVVVTFEVPLGASGLVDTMHLTATSTISPSTSAMVTDTTTMSGTAGNITVTIAPDNNGSGQPDSLVVYTHLVTNTGEVKESFSLSAVSSNGWITGEPPEKVVLDSLESASVAVTVTVPSDAPNGEVDVVTVTVRSDTYETTFDTAQDTTTVEQTFGVLLEPNNTGTADAGNVITYSHVITNTGNGTDRFTFIASSSNGWETVEPDDLTLVSGMTETIVVSLTVPSDAVDGQDIMHVVAKSLTDSSANDNAVNTTNINGPVATLGVDIYPDGSKTAEAGTTVQYLHTIENTGNATDSYLITAVSTQGWPIIMSTERITLAKGDTADISVRINIPGTADDDTVDRTVVTVTSITDNAITDSATNITTIGPIGKEESFVYLPMIMTNNSSTPTPIPTPITPTPTPVSCTSTDIDLVVTEIRVEPANPVAGETATVFITLRNQGSKNVAYGNNFFLDFYVDRVPQVMVAGNIGWGIQGDDLNAGTSKTYSTPYVFTGGAHQLYAQADTDNTVNECPNENNNTLGPISLTASGTFISNGALNQIDSDEPRNTPTPISPITPTPTVSTSTSSTSTPTPSVSSPTTTVLTPTLTISTPTPTKEE